MSDHTPGPWSIGYAETGVRWPVIYVRDASYEDGEREIAQVSDHVSKRGRRTPGAAEAEANARLIAAAPDLLRACKMVAEMAVAWQPLTPGDIEEVRGAIAKAEGR